VTKLRARHVVWDWNGTLLDDNHAVLAAVNSVCTQYGRGSVTLDEWRSVFSRQILACNEKVLGQALTEADWDVIDRHYHDAYRLELDTCGLATGVPELLRQWRDAGRTQSLLSMWFHEELVPLVGKLSLTGLFDRVDGLRGYNMGGSKAAHLVEHLEAQDLDPADVVMIGDVVDDAEAAAKVGAQCVLVTTGMMPRSRLAAAGVPVTDSIPEALALIDA
jgi:phosphoglycolate phosphatase-like HAD superfamily hydrolase